MAKACPTNRVDRQRSTVTKKNGRKRPLRSRRAKAAEPPQIFVGKPGEYGHSYARAHLRNRNGYVYLTWREGKRVRTFYLGKAPRKSPTAAAPPGLAPASSADVDRDLPRRAKRAR